MSRSKVTPEDQAIAAKECIEGRLNLRNCVVITKHNSYSERSSSPTALKQPTRIVSFLIRDSNDNPLVFDTFDAAIAAYPLAHPLFHSDRGFQYTNRKFHNKLEKAGMTQSMSRVGRCIDNGPMEGFWGILKRERYYGGRFTGREELVEMIENFIVYYNSKHLQGNLSVITPMEKYAKFLAA